MSDCANEKKLDETPATKRIKINKSADSNSEKSEDIHVTRNILNVEDIPLPKSKPPLKKSKVILPLIWKKKATKSALIRPVQFKNIENTSSGIDKSHKTKRKIHSLDNVSSKRPKKMITIKVSTDSKVLNMVKADKSNSRSNIKRPPKSHVYHSQEDITDSKLFSESTCQILPKEIPTCHYLPEDLSIHTASLEPESDDDGLDLKCVIRSQESSPVDNKFGSFSSMGNCPPQIWMNNFNMPPPSTHFNAFSTPPPPSGSSYFPTPPYRVTSTSEVQEVNYKEDFPPLLTVVTPTTGVFSITSTPESIPLVPYVQSSVSPFEDKFDRNSRFSGTSAQNVLNSARTIKPQVLSRFFKKDLNKSVDDSNISSPSSSCSSPSMGGTLSSPQVAGESSHYKYSSDSDTPIAALGSSYFDSPPFRNSSGKVHSSPQRKPRTPSSVRFNDYSVDNLQLKYKVIDTHCHLDFLFNRMSQPYHTLSEFKSDYSSMFPDYFEGCVAIFCDPTTYAYPEYYNKILDESGVWGSFGVHPHHAGKYTDAVEENLKKALKHPSIVAYGEIGLDYSNRNGCTKEIQHRVFRRQLLLAIEKGLPLVIHSRESSQDTRDILKELVPVDYKIHLHCFTGDWEEAKIWLQLYPNLYLGLTPLVTYGSAKPTHEVARYIPLDRLLLETDAPYFVPRKVSKSVVRFSNPGLVIHTAAQVAAIRDITIDHLLRHVRQNTNYVYGI